MSELITDYRRLFLEDVPLLDARAPVEFGQGAFPGAVNLPLMNDDERHQVGLCYKQKGPQAAQALGHRLVSGEVKRERIAAWADFTRRHPQGALYCFRGGLRSQIVQQWLSTEAGIDYPRVAGGYKALRGFLIEVLGDAAAHGHFLLLGGLTGTGKTDLVNRLPMGIDLEGHAHHRGSSFGARVGGQPTAIDFENRIAIDLLKKQAKHHNAFVLEDEGRHVGSCGVPLPLRLKTEQAPLVWVEDEFDARVERILNDYVIGQCAEYVAAFGEHAGFDCFAEQLIASLGRLVRRLGGERHQKLLSLMQIALEKQRAVADTGAHRAWIAPLMRDYYDPMYAHQRKTKRERIVFTGDRASSLAYAAQWAERENAKASR